MKSLMIKVIDNGYILGYQEDGGPRELCFEKYLDVLDFLANNLDQPELEVSGGHAWLLWGDEPTNEETGV